MSQNLIDELRRVGLTDELLYNLLPDFIRYQDYYRHQPLRALMAVLEIQYQDLAANIAQLYDNWFIETCDDWTVPYIGDLLAIRELSRSQPGVFTQRARVANTLALRRRKGTNAALARAAQETTGWYTYVVDYRHLLGRTQSLEHLKLDEGRILDLRELEPLDSLDTPFDRLAHTVNVTSLPQNVDSRRSALDAIPGTGIAGYNLPTLGLFIWRLQVYPRSLATARQIEIPEATGFPHAVGYTFHPFGLSTQLFNLPRTPSRRFQINNQENLPIALPAARLSHELEERRQGKALESRYLDRPPIWRIRTRPTEASEPIPIERTRMWIYDLSDWSDPQPIGSPYVESQEGAAAASTIPVLIDPTYGRLLFPHGKPGQEVNVSYQYAASGDLGGGPYPRQSDLARANQDTWVGVVFRDADAQRASREERPISDEAEARFMPSEFSGLQQAVDAWRASRASPSANAASAEQPQITGTTQDTPDCPDGLIRIADNSTYGDVAEDPTLTTDSGVALRIDLQESERLIIEATEQRIPCLVGDVLVNGSPNAALVLNGLWINGSILIRGSCDLHLRHCTLQPTSPEQPAILPDQSKTRDAGQDEPDALTLNIERSLIDGPIRLPWNTSSLRISDSVISSGRAGGQHEAIGGLDGKPSFGPPLTVLRSTLLGRVTCAQIPLAANCLFTEPVTVIEPRYGEIRYSYVPPGSITPRRFRCQPDLALESSASDDDRQTLLTRLVPTFTSVTLGDPGYSQLRTSCPLEIASGAQDGSEMGAHHFLRHPQRAANLPGTMDEFLRWGHDSRISFVT